MVKGAIMPALRAADAFLAVVLANGAYFSVYAHNIKHSRFSASIKGLGQGSSFQRPQRPLCRYLR